MIEIIWNFISIFSKKIIRIVLFICLNIFVLIIFSTFLIPFVIKIVHIFSEIEINSSIVNIFVGALLGLNTSLIISSNKIVNDVYKDEILKEYAKYKRVVDITYGSLIDKDPMKLLWFNFPNINQIVEIDGSVFQERILNQLNSDIFNIEKLNNKLKLALNILNDYMKYFFHFTEEELLQNQNYLLCIMDIYFGKSSEGDKIQSIDYYFQKFQKNKTIPNKSANDFFTWYGNYHEIQELNCFLAYMIKQMKHRQLIIGYNYNYCYKKIRFNLFRDV